VTAPAGDQAQPEPYLCMIMALVLRRDHPEVYARVLSVARAEMAASRADLRGMRSRPGWGD